jgi:outer membrane protein assembly factor BamB
MKRLFFAATVLLAAAFAFCLPLAAVAVDWMQFRGPGGCACSDETGLPTKWSETENIAWKTKLPGLGTSSPITVGDSIFLTCYSGYGESHEDPGDQKDLMRHVVCLDRKSGTIRWSKEVKPQLPESQYRAGNDGWHGYASSTPASDGERIYVFFGRSGVFCFDLAGKQLWQADVGSRTTGWGSATSPVVYKNVVIANASVESGALVGINKMTGKEQWRASGTGGAWNSPILVEAPGGRTEVVLSLPSRRGGGKLTAYDPETGKELWNCEGIPDGYVCPSVTSHDGIVYAIGGRKNTAVAVKAGGSGQVKPLWTAGAGSNVCSPVYHDGHVYWLHDSRGIAYCLDAKTGKQVYAERVPKAGRTYASGIVADGKLYYVSQTGATFVVAAKPKFELLATNRFEDDARTNASPVVDDGRLLIRSDKYLYCIGPK